MATIRPRGKPMKPLQKAQVKQISKHVQRSIARKSEMKVIDTEEFNIPYPQVTNTTLFKLDLPQNGSAFNERVGLRINVKSIQCNMVSVVTPTITDRDALNRIIIFKWNDDDAANPPSASQLFQNTAAGVISQFNWQHVKQGTLRVLYDRLFGQSFNIDTALTTGQRQDNAVNVQRPLLRGRRVAGKEINFNSTASTNGVGCYYVALVSTNTSATDANRVQFSGRFRMQYTDA